ncbi:MAG: GtrA family protein [Lautropia sp.]
MARRLATFVAVGTSAALVHLGTVVLLVESAIASPLRANVVGWLAALVVSFAGHRRYTFADATTGLSRSLRRFFVISGCGFVVNQAAYAALLARDALAYDLALAVVLVTVAVATYVASRLWAFGAR